MNTSQLDALDSIQFSLENPEPTLFLPLEDQMASVVDNPNEKYEIEEEHQNEAGIPSCPANYLEDKLEDLEQRSFKSGGFGIEAITPTIHCNLVSDFSTPESGTIRGVNKQIDASFEDYGFINSLGGFDSEEEMNDLSDTSTPIKNKHDSSKTMEGVDSTPTSANTSSPSPSPAKIRKNLHFEEDLFDESRPLTSIKGGMTKKKSKYSPHIYRKDSITKRAIRSMNFLVKTYFLNQLKKSEGFVAQRKGKILPS